jgi:hypothetical protein
MGAESYGKEVGIPLSKAQRALEQYKERYAATFAFAKK